MTRRPDEVCTLLQEIGLPAVRVKPVTAEVISHNELFVSLVDAATPFDERVSFSEVVLRRLAAADRTSWEAAFANQTPVQVHVGFSRRMGEYWILKCARLPPPAQKVLSIYPLRLHSVGYSDLEARL